MLLVSVVFSGIPLVEVHSHEKATIGHSHDVNEFFDHHGEDDGDTEDAEENSDSFHAHNINATSLSLISSVDCDIAEVVHTHSLVPPPHGWPPDNIVAPLYRPPIA